MTPRGWSLCPKNLLEIGRTTLPATGLRGLRQRRAAALQLLPQPPGQLRPRHALPQLRQVGGATPLCLQRTTTAAPALSPPHRNAPNPDRRRCFYFRSGFPGSCPYCLDPDPGRTDSEEEKAERERLSKSNVGKEAPEEDEMEMGLAMEGYWGF